MPIFMDRHDVSETVTAEVIAKLHQEDIKIQQEFDCRGLTYWFDDQRKTAFCLIEAPDANAIKKMHSRAHGDVPHSIIEVESNIVESFLGRIGDPKKAKDTELNIIDDPAFRIIMIVSVNRMIPAKNNASRFKSFLSDFNPAIRKILKAHEGNRVKDNDTYYLVSFKSVTKAMKAALEIQLLNKELTKNHFKEKISLKIGLSAGVPVTKKQLLFEDTIKLAERMCEIVIGEIIVSAEVKDLYKSENANTFIKDKAICALSQADEKFLNLLMDYFDEAWSDTSLKVDSFSKPLGCSKTQLYRKMISLTGLSPNAFVQEYRLKNATQTSE